MPRHRIPSFYRERWARESQEAPGISVQEGREILADQAAREDPAGLAGRALRAAALEEIKLEGRAVEVAPAEVVLVGVVSSRAAVAEALAERAPGDEAGWPASP